MNNYEIIKTIGEGAYGVVLKARRIDNNSLVAIKKFKETDDDDLIRKTTVRQLKVLKSLQHKNIVELKQAFKKRGIVCLVFQFLDNNLLEVLENSTNGLPFKMIIKLIYQLLQGLQYMHRNNYIHRDIKPENLLINKNQGILKLCDMGFARLLETEMTDYVATRWYRPPQLLIGTPYDKSIDIWAVGCIMAQLSDSQPLFPGADQIDQLYQIVNGIGDLPNQLKDKMNQNPLFKGVRFPFRGEQFQVLEKYRNKLTDKGVNLLKMMLQLNPSKRITASEALKHSFFDVIRPKKHRFQKTSQGWLIKPKQVMNINQNYTDRRFRDSTNQACPVQNIIKCSMKQKKVLINNKTSKIKNSIYKIKEHPNRNTHFHSNFTNSSNLMDNNSILMDINMNKIYRKIDYNSHNNKLLGLTQKTQQKMITQPKAQKIHSKNLISSSSQQHFTMCSHNKTKTQFRVGNSKKQRSNYWYGNA